jgi:hypothetical protein
MAERSEVTSVVKAIQERIALVERHGHATEHGVRMFGRIPSEPGYMCCFLGYENRKSMRWKTQRGYEFTRRIGNSFAR